MDIPKTDEQVFEELFLTKPQRSLYQGDMKGAKAVAATEKKASFALHKDQLLEQRLGNMLDDEMLSRESYQAPRFSTLDEATETFKPKDEIIQDYTKNLKALDDQIAYLESLEQRKYIQALNMVYELLPSMTHYAVSYTDPRAYVPPLDVLVNSKRKIEQEIQEHADFIKKHPRWFLKKQYYKKDQFGLEEAQRKCLVHGQGQDVLVIDDFPKTMPARLQEKCTNYLTYPDAKKKADYHGAAVASVAVDREIGVAPEATFTLVDIALYGAKTCRPMKSLPNDIKHILDFQGTSVEIHHLEAVEQFLEDGATQFGVKLGENSYSTLDLSAVPVPTASVINMSFGILDAVGEGRNSARKDKMHHFLSFVVMIVQWARAGKLMIWAAGNHSLVAGASKEVFTLIKAMSQHRPASFVLVLALDSDLTSLSWFTNQPGTHEIASLSLCAPGTDIQYVGPDGEIEIARGTSYAAPFVSGAAILLQSNFPEASLMEIRHALLFTATPVVIKQIASRLGEFPVVLRGVHSGELGPEGVFVYFGKDGTPKKIFATQEMIKMGRARYGAGIINISAAYDFLARKLKSMIE